MDLESEIQRLKDAIRNQTKTFNIEKNLIANIEKIALFNSFLDLPVQNIGKLLSDSSSSPKLVGAVIHKLASINADKAATLLNYLDFPDASGEECAVIVSSLSSSIICQKLSELIEQTQQVDLDWDYNISKKDEEIKQLKEKLKYEDIELPLNYEPNIIIACLSFN